MFTRQTGPLLQVSFTGLLHICTWQWNRWVSQNTQKKNTSVIYWFSPDSAWNWNTFKTKRDLTSLFTKHIIVFTLSSCMPWIRALHSRVFSGLSDAQINSKKTDTKNRVGRLWENVFPGNRLGINSLKESLPKEKEAIKEIRHHSVARRAFQLVVITKQCHSNQCNRWHPQKGTEPQRRQRNKSYLL